MKLTEENIQDWKELFNAAAERVGLATREQDYANTMSDDELLNYYSGFTPEDAINEELSQMDH